MPAEDENPKAAGNISDPKDAAVTSARIVRKAAIGSRLRNELAMQMRSSYLLEYYRPRLPGCILCRSFHPPVHPQCPSRGATRSVPGLVFGRLDADTTGLIGEEKVTL